MSQIRIVDLEVFYCIGVTEAERARPQRLLISVEMDFDFSAASVIGTGVFPFADADAASR